MILDYVFLLFYLGNKVTFIMVRASDYPSTIILNLPTIDPWSDNFPRLPICLVGSFIDKKPSSPLCALYDASVHD